jgi:hypothetical protein
MSSRKPIPRLLPRRGARRSEAAQSIADKPRTYDSSLSKPGRICSTCRTFVAGSISVCPWCGGLPAA